MQTERFRISTIRASLIRMKRNTVVDKQFRCCLSCPKWTVGGVETAVVPASKVSKLHSIYERVLRSCECMEGQSGQSTTQLRVCAQGAGMRPFPGWVFRSRGSHSVTCATNLTPCKIKIFTVYDITASGFQMKDYMFTSLMYIMPFKKVFFRCNL